MATKKQKKAAKERALSIANAASKSVKENQAAMRRATAREGLLAEAGVPFPHLTIHKRVAAGKTSRETPAERQTRATKTAGATSMAIAKAGGIKGFEKKIDERVKEIEKKEEKKEEKKKETKKKVITKKKIVPKKKVIAKKKEVSTKERVKLTPKMTGGSEYLATKYDRPGLLDWSDLAPPEMPGTLGTTPAQAALLDRDLALYQPWRRPGVGEAFEYQPPAGPTYATRASLLGSSPAEVAAAVANNQQNNQQLNNPLATDPNAWSNYDPKTQQTTTNFADWQQAQHDAMYPGRQAMANVMGGGGLNFFGQGGADFRSQVPSNSADWLARYGRQGPVLGVDYNAKGLIPQAATIPAPVFNRPGEGLLGAGQAQAAQEFNLIADLFAN